MDAAVIGCGKFGYYHAEKYRKMDGVNLLGIADTDYERVSSVAKEFGCSYSDDYKSCAGADLVSIATPNAVHYEIAKFFIEQGVDVLIEKPMTESSAELKDLIERARAKGVRLWGGFLERYNDIFKKALNLSHVQEIYSHRSCTYRDCRKNEDVVFDLMIHDIYLSLIVLRVDGPYEVEVEKSNSLSNCNDFVRAKVQFENGDKLDLTARRDIEQKTKLFCVKAKDAHWAIFNLKKKTNDTLKEELEQFVSGEIFDINLALKSLQMAEKILKGG